MVIVSSVPYSSLKVGDIIVYDPPCSATGNSVIHRIVAITSSGLVTKGDNNFATDQEANIATGPVTASCVEGDVVLVVPYFEKLAFLPYDANYVIAAVIIAVLLLSEVYSSRKDRRTVQESPP